MLLKRIYRACLFVIFLCWSVQTVAQKKPNIIIILADDMGYGDLGSYGQEMIQTPHIDSLATAGMRFTDYYAGCTVCAPSREAMLTGMTTGHTFIRGNFLTDQQEDPAMPSDKVTIAELLKKAGYKTGIYGKWGLGGDGHGPETQGFDSSLCYLDQINAHNYYPLYLYNNGKRVNIKQNQDNNKGLYSHDLFVNRTLNFIQNNKEDEPFFLYLSYTLPHGSYSLPPEEPYKSKEWPEVFKVYATMVSKLDSDVGRIIGLLRKKNILDNTVILFTSDNGANLRFAKFFKSNGPLRGGKRDLYEGGIREPMIVFWPEKILPGSVSNHVTAAYDVLPTLCDIAEVKVPDHVDGLSFLPVLSGGKQNDHEFLYWEYYQYNYNWYKKGNTLPRNYLTNRAVRYGKWKGVQNNIYRDKEAVIELYDLSRDISEQNDVASLHPDVIKKIKEFFRKSNIPNAPFFPYAPDSLAKLHTFKIHTPQQLKNFFHYTSDRIPFVSSHRGGPTLGYPENCLATFTHTLRHTWSVMEVDPHYTKDSAIILMHDPTLDRTSTGQGKISDYTLEQLKELNLRDPMGHVTKFKIPTLDDALAWARGKTILILDQKDVPAEVRARKIKKHRAEAYAMVMCYTYEDAKKVYEIDEDIMMEVFIPNISKAREFEKTGVPWENVIAFVTHDKPKNKEIFSYLHSKGVMTIRGSSRNVDREYSADKISKAQLEEAYKRMVQAGADIIEADLGVQAGKGLDELRNGKWSNSSKRKFFIFADQ